MRGTLEMVTLPELVGLVSASGAEGLLELEGAESAAALDVVPGGILVLRRGRLAPRDALRDLRAVLGADALSCSFTPGVPAARSGVKMEIGDLLLLAKRVRGAISSAGAPRPSVVSGELHGVPLRALLVALRGRRVSGTLVVEADRRREAVVFAAGEAFVRSALATAEGAAAAGRAWDPFLEVALAPEASFHFSGRPRRKGERPAGHAPLQTDQFLFEAIRSAEAVEVLDEHLGRDGGVVAFTSAEAKLSATREATEGAELLSLIDGRLPLDELVRLTSTPRLVAVRVVARLLADGELEPANKTRRSESERAAASRTRSGPVVRRRASFGARCLARNRRGGRGRLRA